MRRRSRFEHPSIGKAVPKHEVEDWGAQSITAHLDYEHAHGQRHAKLWFERHECRELTTFTIKAEKVDARDSEAIQIEAQWSARDCKRLCHNFVRLDHPKGFSVELGDTEISAGCSAKIERRGAHVSESFEGSWMCFHQNSSPAQATVEDERC
eukprot:7382431-Prymnesium_polylepis.3